MRNFSLLVALLAVSAWAGETFIGRLYVSDGGTVSNASTGYASAGCASQSAVGGAGACDQAFVIGVHTQLTIITPEACCVSINRGTTDAGICTPTTAGQWLPTSTSSSLLTQTGLPDGGSYTGALVSISGNCHAQVFTRDGRE